MKITVLVNDNYPGMANPLIYTVDVDNVNDEDEILEAVKKLRLDDIGELAEGDELDLTLLVAFRGDISPIADWRG